MADMLPFVIGHRGAKGLAPENTLAGFQAAKRVGVRWVEFDVKLSRDGIPLLFHDDFLDRTTNAQGRVMDRTWAELAGLDAGSYFSPGFKGEGVPRLDQAIVMLGTLGLGANIEIKPSPGTEAQTAAETIAVVRKLWPGHLPKPLLTSFALKAMEEARRLAPDLPKALLVEKLPEDWKVLAKTIGANAVHLDDQFVTTGQVASVRQAGLGVRVYTVNDPGRAAALSGWGVSSVFTDYPNLISVEK